MPNLLILYYLKTKSIRVTIADHLYSFKRYSPFRCFYVNMGYGTFPRYLLDLPFAGIVFHTTFLSTRWSIFDQVVERARPVKDLDAVKIALPQDEFFRTIDLCEFINEFDVRHVFSVMPEDEWPVIYREIDHSRTFLHRVLTGYLEGSTLKRIEELAEESKTRPIDIGYRAYGIRHWLGRHGYQKIEIARIFEEAMTNTGLVTDISTSAEDTHFGDDWYRFLLKCRYTIGIEGGASILDEDGSIRERTERYVKQNPLASYEETEAACFLGVDNNRRMFAISPRHLEACATRTAQILVEGDYNGLLEPGRHYIELKRDYSNLDEIIELVKSEGAESQVVENAYADIVASNEYTYERFVNLVLNESQIKASPIAAKMYIVSLIALFRLELSNKTGRVITSARVLLFRVLIRLPEPLRARLRPLRARQKKFSK